MFTYHWRAPSTSVTLTLVTPTISILSFRTEGRNLLFAAREEILRLHHGQQEPCTLRRRHRLSRGPGPATQSGRDRQLHQALQNYKTCLLRGVSVCEQCNRPRNGNQEMASRKESRTDSSVESYLGRTWPPIGASASPREKQIPPCGRNDKVVGCL